MSNESRDGVQEQAREAMRNNRNRHQGRQFILWIGALILGAILGWIGIPVLNQLFDFIATVFTRLFQFIAIPTIALAVITTLSALGAKKETGRIFAHAVTYTLLTTITAAAVGLTTQHQAPAAQAFCFMDWSGDGVGDGRVHGATPVADKIKPCCCAKASFKTTTQVGGKAQVFVHGTF